jgi:hypothetical protein
MRRPHPHGPAPGPSSTPLFARSLLRAPFAGLLAAGGLVAPAPAAPAATARQMEALDRGAVSVHTVRQPGELAMDGWPPTPTTWPSTSTAPARR